MSSTAETGPKDKEQPDKNGFSSGILAREPTISFVIPLFNGAHSIATVVGDIFDEFQNEAPEIILVNDGSTDDSEKVGRQLADCHAGRIVYVQLARNFGEHRAVLAGIKFARGEYVAILDDDGQHPAVEVRRMLATAQQGGYDVVFGRYLARQHSWWRRAASTLHNHFVSLVSRKPLELYLSSFKLFRRFVADDLRQYQGAFPHVDALVLRSTSRLGQVDVVHRPRLHGRSGYTLRKLVRLWLDFVLGYSDKLARWLMAAGAIAVVVAMAILITALFTPPTIRVFAWAAFWLICGGALFQAGLLGQFGGRWSADGCPPEPYTIRYVYCGGDDHA